MIQTTVQEVRLGHTGKWTFVLENDHGVLAISEWGTNYWFTKPCWNALLILVSNEKPLP